MATGSFKLILDESVCSGHGRCYELAPEVFEEDDRGHCVLKLTRASGELEERARLGVASCPEEALRLVPEE